MNGELVTQSTLQNQPPEQNKPLPQESQEPQKPQELILNPIPQQLQNQDKKKKKKQRMSDAEMIDNLATKKKKKNLPATLLADDKKKKKKLTLLDKKKKKILQITGIPYDLLPSKIKRRLEFDGMKDKICGMQFGDFVDIDVDDRTLYWGLGVEHEMHLFHRARTGMKDTAILFNSQESTCTLSGDRHPQGACCKMQRHCFTHNKDAILSYNLSKEEQRYLNNMQWELSGRQAKGCQPDATIIKRVQVLMPELITTNFTNRTIQSISQEIRELEEKFITIQMKNPYTREKVATYGPLTTHSCGSLDNILVPTAPTTTSPEYKFEMEPMADYLGSYHVTITLPYARDVKKSEFIKMHREMANQIQWLEPLLTCAFFSGTAGAVGAATKKEKDTEGSFRVMNIGWGNFAGSNVRKMGTTGLDRGANIFPRWRRGFHFDKTKKLDHCARTTPPYYRKATSIHTGDFRTFGYEPDFEKCKTLYRADECPKADGAPIRPPYGLEIRIFDHFPSEYLIELLRVIVLIAANAVRHPAKGYVYNNKHWISALREIMRDGWNATLTKSYVAELRENLGLPIQTDSLLAFDILTTIVAELHRVNRDSLINRVMNEQPDIEPKLPEINRQCWEMPFVKNYQRKLLNIMRRVFYPKERVTVAEFGKRLEASMGSAEWSKWRGDINDVLYALENYNHVKLTTFDGHITEVVIL